MSQVFYCKCGKPLIVTPETAGRRVKCPKCEAVFTAPTIEELSDDSEDVSDSAADVIFGDDQRRIPASATKPETLPYVLDRLCELLDGMKSPATATPPKPKQYKVLTQKDKWFSGKFDPDSIEQALNAYAQQGWVVRGVRSATIPGAFGARDELIVILER